ncbi:hypothetical protein fh0823_01950 [Francisella halioticida]|nr:hypothetical protein [Francisella halioticida]BCD90056.1 hypothetical protein fh0823_01950 [Francisella halioticida]
MISQKYYSTMISDINKKFGINGLTTNDIESEKANKYVKINLQKIMTKNS